MKKLIGIFVIALCLIGYNSSAQNGKQVEKTDPLFKMQKNFKWGFLNTEGEWEIEPKYLWATSFHNGVAAVATDRNTYRFIDKNGDFIFEKKIRHTSWVPNQIGENIPQRVMDSFSEGMAAVNMYKKHYFIDKKGDVIDDDYREVGPFSEGLARVTKDKRNFGFINKKGETVLPFEFLNVGDFSEGLAPAAKVHSPRMQWGYIDKKGNWAITPGDYIKVGPFSEGLAFVRSSANRKYGFVDKTGKTNVKNHYAVAKSFSNGRALVKKEYKWGFIDKTRKMVVPAVYKMAHSFSEGLAAVKKDGDWVYIDTDGKVAITNEILDSASFPRAFRNGYALISVSFNKEYNGSSSSGRGEYKVMSNSWYALMDRDGNFVYKQPKDERAMMKKKITDFEKSR